jgi:1-acyl-sn-glycerol-3-phosphate acyltransferase
MLYRLSTIITYCLSKVFFGIQVEGSKVFPAKQSFILASNHLSNLDPPILACACPRRVGFMAKEELFKNRLAALYLKDVGAIPLKRDKSDVRVIRQALKVLKTRSLLIFPQGTRGGDFDQAGLGVGFLCQKAKVPVIAAKISGTDQILPKGAKFFKPGKVKVIFSRLDNIGKQDSYQDVTSKVIQRIRSL